ncbi:MAG: hypothetical protein ACTHNI_12465 [Cellulosimicrobium cellulans]
MTLPPDLPAAGEQSPTVARPRRRRLVLVVVLVVVLVLVAATVLVVYLDQRPRLERQANIDAVAGAFDDCDLGRTGATVDRDNGSIDFDAVGTGAGPTWDDVECVGDALGMPEEYLTQLQGPGDEFASEELRWDVYLALRLTGDGDTHVSIYHDWQAASYD